MDFYLPDYNIAIECQGEQHFKQIAFGCKDENLVQKRFEHIQELDKNKKTICENNKIKIIYINYYDKEEEMYIKLKNINNTLWK